MRPSFLMLLAALVLGSSEPVFAQDGQQLLPRPDEGNTRVGSRGANFLEIGVGARAMGLGGAYVALSEGVSALYWNPAGIAREPGFGAMLSYNDLYGDFGIAHIFGGVTLPLGSVSAVGISVVQLTSGEILRTTENFPEGNDPQFGLTYEWTSVAFGVTYARQITDRLLVGVTGKYVQEGIEDANAEFFGGDVGLAFRTGLLGTTLGASLQNVGSSGTFRGPLLRRIALDGVGGFVPTDQTLAINFETDDWALPTTFNFSVVWDLVGSPEAIFAPNPDHGLILVTDVVDAIDTDIQSRFGFEYNYRGLVYLRAGKAFQNERDTGDFRDFSDGLSGGLGLRIPIGESGLRLDYAYSGRGILSNIQTFTVEYTR